MESTKLLILGLSLLALANGASVNPTKLDDPKSTVVYKHGERKTGDWELSWGTDYGPMKKRMETRRYEVDGNITACEFTTTSGDWRSSALGVIDGGQGHNFVEVAYTSESGYIHISHSIRGMRPKQDE